MNKIGFKNFRRFQNFHPLEYKGITFLVGRNNSGKSTFVGAFKLLNNFFKNGQIKKFFFFEDIDNENAPVLTFNRALCKNSNEDFIEFSHQLDDYLFELIIYGENYSDYADVSTISITDLKRNLSFVFKPKTNTLTISQKVREHFKLLLKEAIGVLDKEISELNLSIEKQDLKKSSMEYIQLINNLKQLQFKRNQITHNIEEKVNYELYSFEYEFESSKISNTNYLDTVEDFLSGSIALHSIEYNRIQDGKEPTANYKNLRAIKEDEEIIRRSVTEFINCLISHEVFYLGAYSSKQSVLYVISDIKNRLTQSIHDFYDSMIEKGDEAYRFVEKWMKIFEVGDSFEIIIHANEAYEVNIINKKNSIALADKGMGSIQAMLLLFRLASIIDDTKDSINKTVIIEEPELNLHPALQSKLADLFLEVHDKYKINFIIETHSEYLIRKTQLLVKEKEFEIGANENPFCVIYFDDEKGPYKMNYREDGKFIEEFGKGFYDESALLTLNLL